MIEGIVIGLAVFFGGGAIAFISVVFERRMGAIERAQDRQQLQMRIADLELLHGMRELTEEEIRSNPEVPPGAIIDDDYRTYLTAKAIQEASTRW